MEVIGFVIECDTSVEIQSKYQSGYQQNEQSDLYGMESNYNNGIIEANHVEVFDLKVDSPSSTKHRYIF